VNLTGRRAICRLVLFARQLYGIRDRAAQKRNSGCTAAIQVFWKVGLSCASTYPLLCRSVGEGAPSVTRSATSLVENLLREKIIVLRTSGLTYPLTVAESITFSKDNKHRLASDDDVTLFEQVVKQIVVSLAIFPDHRRIWVSNLSDQRHRRSSHLDWYHKSNFVRSWDTLKPSSNNSYSWTTMVPPVARDRKAAELATSARLTLLQRRKTVWWSSIPLCVFHLASFMSLSLLRYRYVDEINDFITL